MPIHITCPTCGKRLRATEDAVGKRVKCPQCQTIVKVAGAAGAAAKPKPTAQVGEPGIDGAELGLDALAGLASGASMSAEERAALAAQNAGHASAPAATGVRRCPSCHFILEEGILICPFCHTNCSSVAVMSRRALTHDGRTRRQKIRDAVLLLTGAAVLLGGAAFFFSGGSSGEAPKAEASTAQEESRSPSEWLHETLLGPDSQQRGNKTFGKVIEEDSGVRATLPFPIQTAEVRRVGYAEEQDGKLAYGMIFGPHSTLAAKPGQAAVAEYLIPEGWRMLQVRYETKDIRSLASQVMNFVGQINQFFALDYQDHTYPLAGYAGIVQRNGEDFLETYYNGPPDAPFNAGYACMLDFKQIDRHELNDPSTRIYLLFLVPVGAEIYYVQNQTGEGEFLKIKVEEEQAERSERPDDEPTP